MVWSWNLAQWLLLLQGENKRCSHFGQVIWWVIYNSSELGVANNSAISSTTFFVSISLFCMASYDLRYLVSKYKQHVCGYSKIQENVLQSLNHLMICKVHLENVLKWTKYENSRPTLQLHYPKPKSNTIKYSELDLCHRNYRLFVIRVSHCQSWIQTTLKVLQFVSHKLKSVCLSIFLSDCRKFS